MKRIELHMDTNHSGRLSFLSPIQAVRLCAQAGCAAVAITDFDSVSAYLDAEQEARRLSIRFLHGLTVRCVDWDDEYDLTLLAKNQEGLQNLFALLALSHTDSAPIRCSVTRQQIEEHRQGLLLGADGRNGQIVRAILCRKTSEYLDAAAEGYDYLELPLEPYDISAELCRIAQRSGKILCAVQYASADGQESAIAEHALRAISLHRKEQPNWSLFQSPERLAQDFQELYRLPAEHQAVLDALWKGPEQILSLVEEFPPLFEQLDAEANRMHTVAMGTLRKEVSTALRQRYGINPPQAISDRVTLELRRVDEEKSAPGLFSSGACCQNCQGTRRIRLRQRHIQQQFSAVPVGRDRNQSSSASRILPRMQSLGDSQPRGVRTKCLSSMRRCLGNRWVRPASHLPFFTFSQMEKCPDASCFDRGLKPDFVTGKII